MRITTSSDSSSKRKEGVNKDMKFNELLKLVTEESLYMEGLFASLPRHVSQSKSDDYGLIERM
jgi:hypothetical protein